MPTDNPSTAPKLPPLCYARHPETGATVLIVRGEDGYHPVQTFLTPAQLNAALAEHGGADVLDGRDRNRLASERRAEQLHGLGAVAVAAFDGARDGAEGDGDGHGVVLAVRARPHAGTRCARRPMRMEKATARLKPGDGLDGASRQAAGEAGTDATTGPVPC